MKTENRFASTIQTLSKDLARKHRFYMRLFLIGVCIITIASGIFIIKNSVGLMSGLTIFVVLMSLLPCILIYHGLNFFYKRTAKSILTESIAEAANMTYERDGVMKLSDVLAHKILPSADAQSSEDGFSGVYHDVRIDLQEVRLTDVGQRQRARTANQRRTTYESVEHDVFWGVVIRLRLQKPMEGHTIVMPRSRLQSTLRTKFTEFQKINLVSPKWKKSYDVISTDQVEARVVMNPAFIERFMEASKIFRAKYIEASFKDSEILFAIHRGRDLFESLPLWQTVTAKRIETITRELEIIFEIIDVLKLNKQINI